MPHSARLSSFGRTAASSAACLVLIALAGCAGVPSADSQPADKPPVAVARPAAAPTAPPPAPPAAVMPAQRNPVVIEFPARSVLLTEDARALLPQLVARAKAASDVQLMGFCDKAQAINAREIAIGRGIAVRNELVRLGVPAAKLKVRYTTTEPQRHAVDMTFEEAGAKPAR